MASRSVNKVILVGHLCKDAETKFTPSGVAKTSFSVATNRRWKQGDEWKEATDFHNVVLWRSENVASYLLKGKQVYLEGRLETRYWDAENGKRYITEVVADDVILLGGGRSEERQPVSAPRPSRQAPQQGDLGGGGITDDDVPFMRFDVPVI